MPNFLRSIMLHSLLICLIAGLSMLAIACSPTVTPDSTLASPSVPTAAASPSTSDAPLEVIQRLKTALANQSGIAESDISLASSEAVEWGDACLGVPQPNEMCAQVITPGYRVVLTTPQGEYSIHSDRSGQTFRIERSP